MLSVGPLPQRPPDIGDAFMNVRWDFAEDF